MSTEAMKWAEGQQIKDGTVMSVLRAVAWHADKGTGECCKSQAAIAKHARVSLRSVQYALEILERLEVIQRRARSKGIYGRSTDAIALSLSRNFDISKAAVASLRKAVRAPLQHAHGAGSAKACNMHTVRLQHAPCAGELNKGDKEESHHGDGSCSNGREVTYPHTRDPFDDQSLLIHDGERETLATGQVIAFPVRGVR